MKKIKDESILENVKGLTHKEYIHQTKMLPLADKDLDGIFDV